MQSMEAQRIGASFSTILQMLRMTTTGNMTQFLKDKEEIGRKFFDSFDWKVPKKKKN